MIGVRPAAWIVGGLLLAGHAPWAGVARAQPDTPASALVAEWLVPGTTAPEALAAARAELVAEGFKIARADREAGVLVTRARAYVPTWPAAAELKLPPSQRPTGVAVHLFVAPNFVPARVAIAVVLDVEETFAPVVRSRNKATLKYYSNPALSSYFASRIAARTGWALTPLAATADARAAQVADLPARHPAGCGVAPLLPRESKAMPVLVSQVKPIYPRLDLQRHASGVVLLRAEVTEHGTLTGMSAEDDGTKSNLVAAAFGAAALWRFRPALVDGCPARRSITIEMSFTLGR